MHEYSVTKNIIDLVILHNSILSKMNYKKRNANSITKYNIEKNFTNLFVFNLENNILFVGGSGLDNYSYIQDAINDSLDDDIIFIYSGIYNESIIINKQITIKPVRKIFGDRCKSNGN